MGETPEGEGEIGVVPDVRRIAVLRANGIGDMVFALPALEALRATYPDAEITLLGASLHSELFANRPSPLDRVVTVPLMQGVWLAEGSEEDSRERQESFFAEQRAQDYDLALQLHGGGRFSNPFVLRLGARVTAGLRTPDAAPLDRWVRYIYYHPEILRYLEVVALVGARPVGLQPRLVVTDEDRAEATRALGDGGADGALAVLNPGASDPRRRYAPERMAAVGDALARAGCEIVVSGDDRDDVASADRIIATMTEPARSLAGRLSLGGLAGLLARATVVISNDSGPLHVARAVGTSSVGIYWCGNAFNGGPPSAHHHRAAISWQTHCPHCGVDSIRDSCDHSDSFVDVVPVEEVVEPALDLLSLGR
jgi:ADP-heptose:LPS heptosyltransferase